MWYSKLFMALHVALGAAVAALSTLPYGWAHDAASSIGAAIAVLWGTPLVTRAVTAVRGWLRKL